MITPTDKPDDDMPQAALDELNRRLAIMMNASNAAPDPEMGGLSPDQVARLIHTEWGAAGGAVQFNTDIPLAELEKAPFFREARIFLKALLDSGGVRATTSKNLPRRFVADVLPLLCDEEALEGIYRYPKVVNEQDVPPLHHARAVAQLAGLVRLYKGKLGVPEKMGPLLEDERAGELFRALFVAFFRRFNLAYTDRVVFEVRGLQSCAAYTLYRLGVVATDWKAVDDLPAEVVLPAVREEVESETQGNQYWTTGQLLTTRLIRWFVEWGMLEGRYERKYETFRTLTAVRVTPLHAAVLRFNLD
jgi:hypothetical protein